MPHSKARTSAPITCVYCGKQTGTKEGEGDHVIPAQLGEFRGDKHFYRICKRCNSEIGKCEQQMLQCGPERIYREYLKPALPRCRSRRGSSSVGAMGAPPPQTFVEDPSSGQRLALRDPDDPRNATEVDQLVVTKGDRIFYIQLFPGMRPDQLKSQMNRKGIITLAGAELSCADKNWDEFAKLIRNADPACQGVKATGSTEAGRHQVPGRIRIEVTKHYFRAIAKIAFHYYLVHNHRGLRGDEAQFAGIRDFIMNGVGEKEKYLNASGWRFVMPFGPDSNGRLHVPPTMRHVLAASESNGMVVVYVHLFLGPGFWRNGMYVCIGPVGSKIVIPDHFFGHWYVYDQQQPEKGKAGEVQSLPIIPVLR